MAGPLGSPCISAGLFIVERPWQAYGRLRSLCACARAVGGCAAVGLARFHVQQARTRTSARAYASEDVTGSVGAPAAMPRQLRPRRCRRKPISSLRAWPSSTCSTRGGKESARPGKTRAPAHAAPSRRSPAPIPRTAPPAAISWRATCAAGAGNLAAGRSLPPQAGRGLGGQKPAALDRGLDGRRLSSSLQPGRNRHHI